MKAANMWADTVYYLFLRCPLPQARELPAALRILPGYSGRERLCLNAVSAVEKVRWRYCSGGDIS